MLGIILKRSINCHKGHNLIRRTIIHFSAEVLDLIA